VEKTLARVVYLFFGLSVAHWCQVAHVLREGGGCGDVVTDPLWFLINVAGPFAAWCGTALLARRIRDRRRAALPFMVPPLLLGTTAGLAYEVWWLRDYGLDLSDAVWYLPGL
jgi:hypothetical protein